MVDPRAAEINLDAYARLTVALARAGAKRDAVLAAHGLDEGGWQAIDDAWQERFVDATRAVRKAGGDVVKALERLGLSPDAYMRANRHWTQQMTRDEGLAERLRRALE
jgi:hypothetical protein